MNLQAINLKGVNLPAFKLLYEGRAEGEHFTFALRRLTPKSAATQTKPLRAVSYKIEILPAEGARYVLAACTRFHSFQGKPKFPSEHGFLKLVDRASLETVDSLSFSYNQEPASKDAKPDHPSNRCQFVEYIDWGQWQRLRDHYRHKCKPEEFSETKNNCCTCAKDAFPCC